MQAANAGGVAVSGLEMSQNAMRLQWTTEEVDNKLKASPLTKFCPVFVNWRLSCSLEMAVTGSSCGMKSATSTVDCNIHIMQQICVLGSFCQLLRWDI